MMFSENRFPLFRIMLYVRSTVRIDATTAARTVAMAMPCSVTLQRGPSASLINRAFGHAPSNLSFHVRDRNYNSVSA